MLPWCIIPNTPSNTNRMSDHKNFSEHSNTYILLDNEMYVVNYPCSILVSSTSCR